MLLGVEEDDAEASVELAGKSETEVSLGFSGSFGISMTAKALSKESLSSEDICRHSEMVKLVCKLSQFNVIVLKIFTGNDRSSKYTVISIKKNNVVVGSV